MTNSTLDPYANSTFLEWFVRFQSVSNMWENHPTFLLHELDYYLGGLVTLIHALRSGGRYPYLWLAAILHGIVLENVVFGVPDMNNFWHAQALVTFRGGRLPGNIIALYPSFIYMATVGISHLRISRWLQPWAVGACVVLMDMPYDIMGIKLLWWTWHDTDPNIFDRHYWVPWTSYYFHTTFAASFTILLMFFRWLFIGRKCGVENDLQTGSVFKEVLVCIFTGMLGMAGGILQFIPFYHPLHDVFHIHGEVIVSILLVGIALLVFVNSSSRSIGNGNGNKFNYGLSRNALLKFYAIAHYLIYFLLVVFSKPENSIVTGLHEPTGPCSALQPINTAFGQVINRKKYLCTGNYDEPVFDWHCLPGNKPPVDGLNWYTICGTPYPNQAEYVTAVTAMCLIGLSVYWHMFSFPKPTLFQESPSTSGKKLKKK